MAQISFPCGPLSGWVAADGFVSELRRSICQSPGTCGQTADPHLCAEWFALLAETTTDPGASFSAWALGRDSTLPLMRSPADPHLASALATFYTPLFGPFGTGQPDPNETCQRAREARRGPGAVAEIRLWPMDLDAAESHVIEAALRRAGWWVDRYFCFGNWYLPVIAGGYDRYFAGRPSQTRNTVTRSAKKLAKLGGYRLQILTRPGIELEQAIIDFVTVYNKSWKRPEPYPRFIPELCRRSALAGSLRLGVVHVGAEPVAAQLWLVHCGKAHIVKLAYDQSFDKASAGSVLTAALMAHVLDVDCVSEVDYLIGDDAYKSHWMTHRRERWGLVAFNPSSLRGLARAVRHWAGRWRTSLAARVRPSPEAAAVKFAGGSNV